MRPRFVLVLCICSYLAQGELTDNPNTIFKLVGDAILSHTERDGCMSGKSDRCSFAYWGYGNGIIVDALMEGSDEFPDVDYSSFTNARLDFWMETEGSFAYNITHNITVPWWTSIGDRVGLYPITYLRRGLERNSTKDLMIAVRTVESYILKWPLRWKTGQITRWQGEDWTGETCSGTNPCFVWGDDAFMGLTLASRLARSGIANPGPLQDFVAEQAVMFEQTLARPTGLHSHAYNAEDGHRSCCAWGRANGWGLMSAVEVLRALPSSHPNFSTLKAAFVKHARAMKDVQSADGRWHQVVDVNSTFLETSSTAMTLFSIATGVIEGWLDKHEFEESITKAWSGLATTVQKDGTVAGICKGFGIHASVAQYETCTTEYLTSSPGLGSVLRAAIAVSTLKL